KHARSNGERNTTVAHADGLDGAVVVLLLDELDLFVSVRTKRLDHRRVGVQPNLFPTLWSPFQGDTLPDQPLQVCPAQPTLEGVEPPDQLPERPHTVPKEVMMRPDQTGLADEDVEGEIHHIVFRVSTNKERDA